MTQSALRIDGLSHTFGSRQALDNVSLTVPAGTFTALLGLNGAGKTTLFSLVTRLYDSTSGTIEVFGFDVRRESPAALSRLGIVFQARTLDLDLSVRQSLLYHAALHGIGRRQARLRMHSVLEKFAIADRIDDKVRNLSGGQMRRLEIARALIHDPALLLLDEPTVGLDVEARESLIKEVRRLASEEGNGILWATHLLEEIHMTDRLIVLHKGRVLAQGTVSEVLLQADAADVQTAFRNLINASQTPSLGQEAAE
ncbi:ATP-binding cassette domain-containing protein [Microvirga sp. ACRRW]|uniref:ABC transporter ATP-binding protein n=1 Tax=Microvirga sp. ACRRW TaxID=2918205 RepID=UPI001EF54241|nr:ABC transporter ATP-binding protein [Microvirga sp. ACRRW]MCG7393810.1 ATP-binding cassette domain-containing protein [Microvirga sp. ACRRW]